MSGDDLADFYVHTVEVQVLLGGGGMGDVFADPVPYLCFVDDKRKLVRSSSGAEIISETTLYGPLADLTVDTFTDTFTDTFGVTHRLTEGSLITLPTGRIATVISTAARDSGVLDLPDHLEAALT